MKLTRKLIIAQPDFKHVLEFRCAMHAFGSTLGSITNHKYFKDIICEAQTIVTFFDRHINLWHISITMGLWTGQQTEKH
jgi:hypothetical protein